MKRKTIKTILRKKVDDWLKYIQDEDLRKEIHDNCIVTGGAIASMLLGEEINDFDIYFTNKETTKKVAEYYVRKFKNNSSSSFKNMDRDVSICVKDDNNRISIMIKSQGIASEEGTDEYQYFEGTLAEDPASDIFIDNVTKILEESDSNGKDKYRPVFLSSNAITLSDKMQLVIRFYGDPEEIHRNYDFVHCTNYWESKTNKLVLRPEALEALLAKELIYVGSRYPLASVIRTRKFINRGFTCNAGQYLKMCYQISELDLNNISVLEDQLVGVDTAYFVMLINALKKKQEEDKNFVYNYSYIIEIVDRIF